MALIEARGLTKAFGAKEVLKDVSFSLESEEILVLTGDNGVGKTTLLSILAAQLKPDSGDVLLEDKSLVRNPDYAIGRIAYIPQVIMLNQNLTTAHTLYFWAAVNKLNKKSTVNECERIISQLSLEPFLKSKIKNLSTGTKRRVNIAVSLFSNPLLILMDEPTAGLDMHSRMELISFTKELANKKTGVIYVTHLADELELLGENVRRLELSVPGMSQPDTRRDNT